MIKKMSLLVCSCLLITAAVLQASFETMRNYNPRGIAMGNAIMADDDPINGFLYNPALIAYTKQLQWQGIFGLPVTGLDDGKFMNFDSAVIVPLPYKFKYKAFKGVALGFSFNRFSMNNENALYLKGDEVSYAEHFWAISVARKWENWPAYGTVFSVGLNANILNHGIKKNLATLNNDYFSSLTKTAFGLDLGGTYVLNKSMIIGGTIENLIPPNTSFHKGGKDSMTMTYKLGLTIKFAKLLFMKNCTGAAALWFRNWEAKDDSRAAPKEYHFGYEFWEFEKLLGVRLGYQWSDYGKSKVKGMSVISLGLACAKTFSAHEIQADVGFQFPLVFGSENGMVDTFGSYIFALTYRWAWPLSWFEFDPQKREELRQIEDLKKQYQQQQQQSQEDTKAQQQDVQATGSVETANTEDPDTILTKANRDRNTKLLALYNDYTGKRDAINEEIKAAKEDGAKKIAAVDKKIEAEQKKKEKAKPEEVAAIDKAIKDLETEKADLTKATNDQVAGLEKKITQLKKDTSAQLKTINGAYDTVKKKFGKKATANFIEEAPSLNYQEFQDELSK